MTSTKLQRRSWAIAVATAVAGGLLLGATGAAALVAPGTPAKDVTFGSDDDNAANSFIQPAGVTAKQHMENTDLLFGRDNDDLLVGNLGSDTLLAGADDDILIGGPDDSEVPDSDVLVGEEGDDINLWEPGDGSDVFAGNEDVDTMVFAPFELDSHGDLVITREHGRKVPHVRIDDQDGYSCTIVPVPHEQDLGYQFLVRFNVYGTPMATVRQKDVERVLCPSPEPGRATVASLTSEHPSFHDIRLSKIGGTLGDILTPAR